MSSDRVLPTSLLHEGERMLQALIHDTVMVRDVEEIVLLRDKRLPPPQLPSKDPRLKRKLRIIQVNNTLEFDRAFAQGMEYCDVFWPVVPESRGLLAHICRMAERHSFTMINSSSSAVNICTSKYLTLKQLASVGLPIISCHELSHHQSRAEAGAFVLKPDDGAGCEGIIRYWEAPQGAGIHSDKRMVTQPWIEGESMSLSAIIHHERGFLLSINQQEVFWRNNRPHLNQCLVRPPSARDRLVYEPMLDSIALAIPGLSAYVGIDFILTPRHGPILLEVNPRLTTSYATLSKTLGWNVGQAILDTILRNQWPPVVSSTLE